eukprot:GFYU01023429.1.p1 GENE.GFYU01023429.1~~GFYU01023429.1.p1  ORF type:complete len:238 (-),score=59.92 GFYU01023429.1:7-720(-)
MRVITTLAVAVAASTLTLVAAGSSDFVPFRTYSLETLIDSVRGDTPPVWPDAFSVQFHEELISQFGNSTNTGAWYYDFANTRARFDHNEGQTNNFCAKQGFSKDNPQAGCRLLFTPETMYMMYPDTQECCMLCGAEEGCTVLKPDWLTGAEKIESKVVNGKACYGWRKQGFVAVDNWYATSDGLPCQYHEYFPQTSPPIQHYITFDDSTYTETVDADLLALPQYCAKAPKCPNPYPN